MKIYSVLTNGLVSGFEYSNGDCHVTNTTEPSDDVMIVVVVLWVVVRTGAANVWAIC